MRLRVVMRLRVEAFLRRFALTTGEVRRPTLLRKSKVQGKTESAADFVL
jgi:hypothetical protein